MRLFGRAQTVYRKGGFKLFADRTITYLKEAVIWPYVLSPLIILVRTVLAAIVPQQPGLVLFGFDSRPEKTFEETYEWILENEPDGLEPVLITNDRTTYDSLVAEGYPAAYRRSLRGQYYILRADVACYESISVYTFHSQLTTIKVRHEVPIKDGPTAAREAVIPTDVPNHDYIVTTSEFLADRQFEYHKARKGGSKVRREQFIPLGYPRNDSLFEPPNEVINQWTEFINDEEYEHVILYAPTRRRHNEYDTQNTDLFPFADFDLDSLRTLLEELNAVLLVRLHPGDSRRVKRDDYTYTTRHDDNSLAAFIDRLDSLNRVRFASSEEFDDTDEILPFTDILITDYSTVYHTFLLLDRPIVFFPYDYDQFEQSFGFKYEYFENLPGPAIGSFSEFRSYLQLLDSGEDTHQDQRRKLQNNIHKHVDGDSTERLVAFIQECTTHPVTRH